MSARCKYCGRQFRSTQGVNGHLRSCKNYQTKKQGSYQSSISDGAIYHDGPLELESYSEAPPAQVAQPRLPNAKTRAAVTNHPPPTIQSSKRDALHLEGQSMIQVERDRHREKEEHQRKKREVLQRIKSSVIDWHFIGDDVPTEAKAKAKLEIERELARLPLLELPHYELRQIGEGIRDQVYAPYLKEISDLKQKQLNQRKEDLEMAKTRLLSGIFVCPKCEEEFELARESEEEAVCEDCNTPLEEISDEE